jgi:hypothetical protein
LGVAGLTARALGDGLGVAAQSDEDIGRDGGFAVARLFGDAIRVGDSAILLLLLLLLVSTKSDKVAQEVHDRQVVAGGKHAAPE